LDSDEFLELVLMDFGITDVPSSKAQRIIRLQELLVDLHEQGKVPVLIVDGAHKLRPEVLEEIRLLTNFESTKRKLLQIVLAGQSELADLLNRDDLRQVKQRVEIRLQVRPLARGEVGNYMRHRWQCAGGSAALPFSVEAISLIAGGARGIPRLVNAICDNALLLAHAAGILGSPSTKSAKFFATSTWLIAFQEIPLDSKLSNLLMRRHDRQFRFQNRFLAFFRSAAHYALGKQAQLGYGSSRQN